jgi:hypothetical protein
MAIVMYDSTNPAEIPLNATLVASYVDGYGGYDEAVSIFGAAKCVSISVGNNDADVADVEPGAMVSSDLPDWVDRQVARGVARPVIYSDQSQWQANIDAVGDRDVAYWIATDSGDPTQEISGADAVQYLFGGSYDLSYVLPSFPFYPGGSTPPGPASQPEIENGSTGAAVYTAQLLLDRHPLVVKPKLAVDGDFGPLTEAGVKQFQAWQKLEVDGIVGPITWASLYKNSPHAPKTG